MNIGIIPGKAGRVGPMKGESTPLVVVIHGVVRMAMRYGDSAMAQCNDADGESSDKCNEPHNGVVERRSSLYDKVSSVQI